MFVHWLVQFLICLLTSAVTLYGNETKFFHLCKIIHDFTSPYIPPCVIIHNHVWLYMTTRRRFSNSCEIIHDFMWPCAIIPNHAWLHVTTRQKGFPIHTKSYTILCDHAWLHIQSCIISYKLIHNYTWLWVIIHNLVWPFRNSGMIIHIESYIILLEYFFPENKKLHWLYYTNFKKK